jgi:hypothetical protein
MPFSKKLLSRFQIDSGTSMLSAAMAGNPTSSTLIVTWLEGQQIITPVLTRVYGKRSQRRKKMQQHFDFCCNMVSE